MRLAPLTTVFLLAATIAACSDSPTQPVPIAPALEPSASLVSASGLARCTELIDPDWLCQSQAVREGLCEAAVSGGSQDIVISGRFFTLRYRVTFDPQDDGSLVVALAFVRADGSLVPIGNPVTIPADKVAKFLEHCPATV